MTMTENPATETAESPRFRRFPLGTAVLWNGRAYSVIETRDDGHVIEMIGNVPARHFAPADTILTPAP